MSVTLASPLHFMQRNSWNNYVEHRVSVDHYCSIHCTFCARLYGSAKEKMFGRGDILFMCGVTKQKYQTRSRQNQYLYVAVSCELLTHM